MRFRESVIIMKHVFYYVALALSITSCVSSGNLYYEVLKKGESIETSTSLLDHSSYSDLLSKYVDQDGLVDYNGLKSQQSDLKSYLDYLSSHAPQADWTTGEQFAYYINLYNAATLYLIIDNNIPASIKDIDGPLGQVWLKEFIKIEENQYSLADIEKSVLQKMGDPRIHFAINCASYSCPKLLTTAYTGENVDLLMDKAAREFVNSSKNDLSDPNNPRLSSIFKFYPQDFKTVAPSIIDYVNQYANTKINPNATVEYKEYDWSLNNQ